MNNGQKTRVLFVCLGNICRSPTAEGVFSTIVEQRELSARIEADSCGTAAWHVGKAPDRRATAAAALRGYDLGGLRARRVRAADFRHFDYILAMDRENLAELEALRPASYPGHLGLLLDFAGGAALREVPDPYYGGDEGFGQVLDLVELASEGLLREICDAHPAG